MGLPLPQCIQVARNDEQHVYKRSSLFDKKYCIKLFAVGGSFTVVVR